MEKKNIKLYDSIEKFLVKTEQEEYKMVVKCLKSMKQAISKLPSKFLEFKATDDDEQLYLRYKDWDFNTTYIVQAKAIFIDFDAPKTEPLTIKVEREKTVYPHYIRLTASEIDYRDILKLTKYVLDEIDAQKFDE